MNVVFTMNIPDLRCTRVQDTVELQMKSVQRSKGAPRMCGGTFLEEKSPEIPTRCTCPALDRDVFYKGRLENSGRKSKSEDLSFWCVWKDGCESYLVGKVQNGEKIHFRIINLTTLTFKVTRWPIDRKLKGQGGRYTQIFHLYGSTILNVATLGTEESLVFVQFNLHTYETTFHAPLPMHGRNLVREMSVQNTIIWGNYFFFVRKVALDSGNRQMYAEVYQYNLAQMGRFRCISTIPLVAQTPLTYGAIGSDRTGIVLFGVRTHECFPYSEKVAVLDVRRMRWTLFPQRNAPTCATLEKMFLAESGGDIIHVKRTHELELWRHNIYTRQTKFLTKISAMYVELVYRIADNNILIVTRENDQFHLIRKGQEAPPALRVLCADTLKRYELHKPPNARLKALGVNRKFFNMLIRD